MENQQLTRQIYWSPSGELAGWLHASQYVWLAIAVAIFSYGVYQKLRVWRLGKPEASFDRPMERVAMFFRYVIGQARVLRMRRQRDPKPHSPYAAWMHGLIFYGFLALVFGTTIVGLEEHGIASLYHGWFYGFVSFICDLGGLALLIGLIMGVARRRKMPSQFSSELDYSALYIILILLVIQGYLLEGFRLSVQENPVDAGFSFVGSLVAYLFPQNLPTEASQNLYSALWYFHMVTTMGFVALVPYTRAMHIVTSTLNLYTQRLSPRVQLPPMDLENPEAEYFGPKKITDFSWKDFLDFDSCTECRRCTDICPANAVEKTLDPRAVILKLRDSMRVEAQFQFKKAAGAEGEERALYESGTITHDEIWACTNCGGCVNECPVGIDQLRSIMQLRRYQTLSLGEVPAAAGKAIENVKQYGNPWGISQSDRFKWAEGLDLPIITGETPEVEWLYYVGCAGSYDASNQKVARSVARILKETGVSFAVMGLAESCTGEPVKRLGDEYSFSEIARSNVEKLSHLKFKKIVTHCPHCYNTFKNDYGEYGGQYEVYHHTQLISALHKQGKLNLPVAMDKTVTFHDPCFLGRHNGEYEAPRALLEAIAGLRLKEMEYTKQTSSCCGMGGGNMWYESEGGTKSIVENRLEHVAATGAKTLVTGCSFCLINFKGAFAKFEPTKDLEVLDIAEAVTLAMGEGNKTASSNSAPLS